MFRHDGGFGRYHTFFALVDYLDVLFTVVVLRKHEVAVSTRIFCFSFFFQMLLLRLDDDRMSLFCRMNGIEYR